jgi:adenosine/AMP kinase
MGYHSGMLREKRILPCGCVLHWDEDHTLIAFCLAHSFDYVRWEGKDEEFIKRVTNTQREIRYMDESILIKMR